MTGPKAVPQTLSSSFTSLNIAADHSAWCRALSSALTSCSGETPLSACMTDSSLKARLGLSNSAIATRTESRVSAISPRFYDGLVTFSGEILPVRDGETAESCGMSRGHSQHPDESREYEPVPRMRLTPHRPNVSSVGKRNVKRVSDRCDREAGRSRLNLFTVGFGGEPIWLIARVLTHIHTM
jgi:hypothetical protein